MKQNPRKPHLSNGYLQEDEQYFQDQPQLEMQEKRQPDEIQQICDLQFSQLNRVKSKNKNRLFYHQQRQQSQYFPGSGSNEESNSHSGKISHQITQNLMSLIKTYQSELRDSNKKLQALKQLSQRMQIPLEIVKKKVYDYFRRKKQIKSSFLQQKSDHQTIYRKTQMFDDAIKRVLKTTPYACINDLKQEIQKKLGLQLAKQTLIRRLKNLKYTYTKFTIQKKQYPYDHFQTLQIRRRYIKCYRQISSKGFPIYFYASCHIATDECRGSMWIKTKQNGQLQHILHQKDVVHVCIILSKQKIEYYKIINGFYKLQSFTDTLKDWAENRLQIGSKRMNLLGDQKIKNCYLIYEANKIHNDGCIHENNQISNHMLSQGVFMLPVPEHSQFLNPAQLLFNQLKYLVKSRVKDFNNFGSSVELNLNNNLDIDDIKFVYNKMQDELEKIK